MDTISTTPVTNRKLASIQKVAQLKPIEGPDRILLCNLEGLGWECVVKKGDFSIGDLCCYIETDSRCPERPEFEFLRERKFKVKIIKLKRQISQGLVMPMSILPPNVYNIGDDVTEILGITNYVKDQENAEENAGCQNIKTKMPRWLMDMAWFRWVYFKLNSNDKGWPTQWAGPKTDECRVQVILQVLVDHFNEPWYIAEKIDGSSGSAFTYKKRQWGFMRKKFGVCSRNIFLKTENESVYWRLAKKLDLKSKFLACREMVCVQGECTGPAIQKNKYGLKEVDLYVFNVSLNGTRLLLDEAMDFCQAHELKFVPIVNKEFIPSKEIGEGKQPIEVVQFMVNLSKGKSMLANRNREGIVCRLVSDPRISFKVISPDFLLEDKDKA